MGGLQFLVLICVLLVIFETLSLVRFLFSRKGCGCLVMFLLGIVTGAIAIYLAIFS